MKLKHPKIVVFAGLIAAMNLLTGQSQCPPGGQAEDPYLFATNPITDYDRVDRTGMPAIATAVITSKDAYNLADPVDDANGDFVNEIVTNLTGLHAALDDDLAAFGLTACDTSTQCVPQAAPLVVPDTLKIDVGSPSGFPNGRRLQDPVMDVTLAVVLLDLNAHSAATLASVPLNPPANDVPFNNIFPYLASPHMP